ncbi:hypothetical protein BofuT4_uP056450.1 [Botrytis cinerea T4]|uniref:Uncharacterized protein n=1 Tax=Botryotinia fuckeliana (strain T4) TaxID=999810 RepID=G2XW74_BOTF4|nr:hypothetical protein BofuT4_uP056450.1 [Botrytis cinerea T4]
MRALVSDRKKISSKLTAIGIKQYQNADCCVHGSFDVAINQAPSLHPADTAAAAKQTSTLHVGHAMTY